MKVGVVTRGKYGHRAIENLRENTSFEVVSTDVPRYLPEFIDEPKTYVDTLDLDEAVFSADLILSYALHPDITEELIRRAGNRGVKAFIASGGTKAGSPVQLRETAESADIFLITHEICCSLASSQNHIIREYLAEIGSPRFKVEVENGVVESVDVLRCSPCGGTRHVARNLPGTPIEDAPSRAGLLVQHYPCRAVRGTEDGIHASGEIHKKALERALKEEGVDPSLFE